MATPPFVKEGARAARGSIPDLLKMFENELRFYREVAPEVGVRVPECYDAPEGPDGFRVVLEDVSSWHDGADPVRVAQLLAEMHQRWARDAERRWPWLRRGAQAAPLIGDLYDKVWADVAHRDDLTPAVARAGDGLVGRVTALERDEALSPRRTLIHGDASLRNMRTSPDGEIVFFDWEDVRTANGAVDLVWLLITSVVPEQWSEVIAAYAPVSDDLAAALPAATAQGVLTLGDCAAGSAEATGWMRPLDAAAALSAA